MQQDNLSYWTEIKTFEEQLSKFPNSFCFARLSEVYLKMGLVYDALHTARQGVEKYPRYLAGLRALAMACNAKGINDECLAALKLVTEAMPEDHQAQKLLGRLLADAGDHESARKAFQTVLEFAPGDVECQMELESLDLSSGSSHSSSCEDDDDSEEILEDLEIFEELDVFEEELPVSDSAGQEHLFVAETSVESGHDPLSTVTLAELHVKQGFINKALDIYRSVLTEDPSNNSISKRIAELELQDATVAGPMPEAFFASQTESTSAVVKPQGTADNAIFVLEGWLENIRRVKSCR